MQIYGNYADIVVKCIELLRHATKYCDLVFGSPDQGKIKMQETASETLQIMPYVDLTCNMTCKIQILILCII